VLFRSHSFTGIYSPTMSSGSDDLCPAIAPFLGYMGVMSAVVFANIGAAAGTAKAGVGIMKAGIKTPEQIWRNLIPVVMAGVNGIYGLITAIILVGSISSPDSGTHENKYSLYTGAAHLAAGMCCGLSGLGSGFCIGIAGDAAVRACGTFDVDLKASARVGQGGNSAGRGEGKKKAGGGDQLFVSMVLIQVFAGNIALYGLISSIILSQQVYYCGAN